MANFITVDGVEYINANLLVDKMVLNCVQYTCLDDYDVLDDEADTVRAYQQLTRRMKIPNLEEKFKEKYVQERFIKRTLTGD
jgi:hypothetical protein